MGGKTTRFLLLFGRSLRADVSRRLTKTIRGFEIRHHKCAQSHNLFYKLTNTIKLNLVKLHVTVKSQDHGICL